MTKVNRLVLSVLVVLSLAAFAAAQSYTITDLGPGVAYAINSLGDVTVTIPNTSNGGSFVWAPDGSILTLPPLPGDSFAASSGINSQGLVAGFSATQSSNSAVLWTNGVPLDLGTLGGTNSEAFGINASGEVVGSSDLPVGYEAFLWTQATGMQGLGSLSGGGDSQAFAVNRVGQVVGFSGANGNKNYYAFIWSKTTGMKNLGKLPGYDSSNASAINDLGQVAGVSICGIDCAHATLWNKAKGSMLDLGVLPGAKFSYALGINNAGQVVGYDSYSGTNVTHAFVWSPSTGMLDLGHLIPAHSGWVLQGANAINDQGQIVGYAMFNGQKQEEAFLLTPQ